MGEYHNNNSHQTSVPSFASAEPNPGRVARVTDLRPSLELHGAGEGVNGAPAKTVGKFGEFLSYWCVWCREWMAMGEWDDDITSDDWDHSRKFPT